MSRTDTTVQDISQCVIRPELIPDHVREDIGRTLFNDFMERIRDPAKLRLYNELGKAFLERQAAKAEKGGSK